MIENAGEREKRNDRRVHAYVLNFKNHCTHGVVTPPLAIDCGTCLCTHVVVSRLLPIIIILLLLF